MSKELPFKESESKINWFSHVTPTHQCPICKLPFWIERTCNGSSDSMTGNKISHEIVMVIRFMTLEELIQALEKISKENPELKEQKVYCQVGREITYIDELNIQFEIKQNQYVSVFSLEKELTEEDKALNPHKVLIVS